MLINSLPAHHAGTIGLTQCPGVSHTLRGDLSSIKSQGADLLLSLITQSELDHFGLTDFGAQVMAHGLRWMHLPIEDHQTPDAQFETRWATQATVLHRALGAGQFVVIHCLAGLGRSGLIACRLLIESGLAPGVALESVRLARRGAVETAAQEAWVLHYAGSAYFKSNWLSISRNL